MRGQPVAKPELGLKRLCPNCGAKYYDLNRSPIHCPKCGAMFDAALVTKVRPAAPDDDEAEHEDVEEVGLHPEFVSLEEAETTDGDDVPDIEEAEIDDDHADDDVFLEEEDEDDDGVTGIIRDVDSEEER